MGCDVSRPEDRAYGPPMKDEFEHLTGFAPLAWQARLFESHLDRGELPAMVDVPTGLGKTAVMALWLIARGRGRPLPRRLVYVVDRRAVVDQATDFAERLRDRLAQRPEPLSALRDGLGLDDEHELPISTLRGQHADNRQWLADPSAAAIIVGTVDMIGSRLLFEGYGVSRKMRPYHAGLLGSDTLVVLDEAHLVPPFERLLDTIEQDRGLGPVSATDRYLIPRFRLLSLSATGHKRPGARFALTEEDIESDWITSKRLGATKRLRLVRPAANDDPGKDLASRLTSAAWDLTQAGTRPTGCVIFCNQRDTALAVRKALLGLAKGSDAAVELFVGARRGRERQDAATRLGELGFLAGARRERTAAAFLVATSAAEVGVDLDADHMVSDLVAWERMVQRLGRVNRRGDGEAAVHVVVGADLDDGQKAVVTLLLEQLPRDGDDADVSPGALRALKERAATDPILRKAIVDATTALPLRPRLTRPLLDAWSMTSLVEHTGRPEVAPWLRGWIEDDKPRTRIAWRTHLPIRGDGSWDLSAMTGFFEAAPPHTTELLETETYRLVDWLNRRARKAAKLGTAPRLCVLDGSGSVTAVLGASEVVDRHNRALERELAGRTVVVEAVLGGLDSSGSLDHKHDDAPHTLDGDTAWPGHAVGSVPFRVRHLEMAPGDDPNWLPRHVFVVEESDDELRSWLQVDKWRIEGANEDDRSISRSAQLLTEHQAWAAQAAWDIAERLGLPKLYSDVLSIAARLHDEGKRAERWQRAFRAPRSEEPYAKTRGPVDQARLGGYRHELGSLPHAEADPELRRLPDDHADLVLHLIAAHHGHARPTIPTPGCDDAPPSALEGRAREIALRFVRLQARWGPWGLAYWEALLRAADQRASRRLDEADGEGT